MLPPSRHSWLLLLFSAGFAGCQHAETPAPSSQGGAVTAEKPALAATLVVAESRPWQTIIRSQGGLVADEATVIGSKVSGRVATVAVDIGDFVHAGDTIARLDEDELKILVEQGEAQLAQARAAVGLSPEQPDDTINRENSPVVRQERAVLIEAQANFERLKMLQERNAVTQADLDTSAAAVAVAEARYAASLNAVEEKLATIRIRRSELALAHDMLKHATIRAPFDGLIQTRQAASGAFVRVGDPIVTLVRIDPLRFRGTVPERRAMQLREGQQVRVILAGLSAPITTRVSRISPALEEFSRSLVFEADLPNPDGRLRSGLFAEAEVVVDTDAEALAIPVSSVVEFAGLEKVWVVSEGEAREVPVRTGRREQGLVEILSGLEAGTSLLLRGAEGRSGPVSSDLAHAEIGG